MAGAKSKVLRIGVIGAGEVAQVIHLPVLTLLSHLFTISIISDLSKTVRGALVNVTSVKLNKTSDCRTLRPQVPHSPGNHER